MKYLFFLIISISVLLTACSGPVAFNTSEMVPAAEGNVQVKQSKNGNYSVVVNVRNLASPERLKPSRKYYVVWAESGEGTFNLGTLDLDKDLTAKLESQSTYKPKKILISAEDDKKEIKIGKQVVLKTKKL